MGLRTPSSENIESLLGQLEPEKKDDIENLLGQLGEAPEPFAFKPGEPRQERDPSIDFKEKFNQIRLRALTSFTEDPQKAAAFVAKRFGSDNVRVSPEGKIFVRRTKEKPFTALDPEGIGTVLELFGDIADVSADILEGGVTLGTELGIISAVTKAPVSGLVKGAAVIGGLGVAGATGAVVRRGVSKLIGFEDDDSLAKDASLSAGLNIAAAGFGKVLKVGATAGGTMIKEFASNLPAPKLIKIARLREAIKTTLNEVGVKVIEPFKLGVKLAARKGAKFLERKKGALFKIQQKLSEDINAVISTVKELSQDAKVSITKPLAEIFNDLESKGFKFNPKFGQKGQSLLRSDSEAIAVAPGGAEDPSKVIALLEKNLKPLFDAEKTGGLTIEQLHRNVQKFQKLSKFDKETNALTAIELRLNQMIQGKLGVQRMSIMQEIAKDAPQATKDFIQDSFTEASEKLGNVSFILDEWKKSPSAIFFAKNLIRKERPEDLDALISLIGDDSQLFGEIKGVWIADLWNQSLDNNGFLDGKKMIKKLDGFGKEILDKLFDEKSLAKFKQGIKDLAEISVKDFEPSDAPGLRNILRLFFGSGLSRKTQQLKFIDGVVFKSMQGNASLADAAIGEMGNIAEKSAIPEVRLFWKNSSKVLEFLVNQSKRIKVPGKPDRLVPIPIVRQAINQLIKSGQTDIPGVPSFISDQFKSQEFQEEEFLPTEQTEQEFLPTQ